MLSKRLSTVWWCVTAIEKRSVNGSAGDRSRNGDMSFGYMLLLFDFSIGTPRFLLSEGDVEECFEDVEPVDLLATAVCALWSCCLMSQWSTR